MAGSEGSAPRIDGGGTVRSCCLRWLAHGGGAGESVEPTDTVAPGSCEDGDVQSAISAATKHSPASEGFICIINLLPFGSRDDASLGAASGRIIRKVAANPLQSAMGLVSAGIPVLRGSASHMEVVWSSIRRLHPTTEAASYYRSQSVLPLAWFQSLSPPCAAVGTQPTGFGVAEGAAPSTKVRTGSLL
jgi:hypothetical protein